MKKCYLLLFLSANFFTLFSSAQTFTPISVSGFNQDVIAESGNSSLTTTTVSIDGSTVSNKVMYTNAFRIANGFGGGGIADNGVITGGGATYQMAPYTGNNCFLIPRNQNQNITLQTPGSYTSLRLLALSTEGTSLVNVTVFFTDGTSFAALTNYSVGDWFGGTANLVTQGFGRCTRSTPTGGADAYPNDPRLYYLPFNLGCANAQKIIQRINVANVTTAGNNAPFPNTAIFAVSGVAYTPVSGTVAVTNASCSGNGSATVTASGLAPLSISYNTTPVQTGTTATNLAAGNYTATITDGNGCTTALNFTVALTNNLALSTRTDTTICAGGSFVPNLQGNGASYSWSPAAGVSNPAILNPTLSPTANTTYTLTATLGSCTKTSSFTVTVTNLTLSTRADTSICTGGSFTTSLQSNGTSFVWTPTNGISNAAILNPTFSPSTTTTYTLTARLGACSKTSSFKVTVSPGVTVNAGPDQTILQGQSVQLQGSGTSGTYLFSPSAGLSSTSILNPTATPTVTTTYTLRITTAQGCTGTDDVIINVVPYCVKPLNAFSPNGDGINDTWFITDGNCLKLAEVMVYNRYGSKVFESKNYQNDWNGTYQGKPLPDGTYYYVINYTLLNNQLVPVKGDVTILR